ncbi:hypothetical protein RSAG8_13483, partial [Rhizoctonia solani AG-8 WAC10335]
MQTPPTPVAMPAVWPVGYNNAQNNLTSLLEDGDHRKESWIGDVLTMFIHGFPVSTENYVIQTKCNLRQARTAHVGEHQNPGSEDKSQPTVQARRDGNGEQGQLKPDLVINHGTRDSPKLVAVVEMKGTATLTQEDRDQFARYCTRITEYAPHVTEGTSVMLIKGGEAYAWNRQQVEGIAARTELTDQALGEAQFANVNTVAFVQMLAAVRNRFCLSFTN